MGDKILHLCAQYGDCEMFTYFEKKLKPNLNQTNKAKETPWIIAAREGNQHFMRYLIENYGEHLGFSNYIEINRKTIEGWTAFSYACCNGMINTIDYLAKECNSDTSIEDKFERTPLHWAALHGHSQAVKALLRARAEPSHRAQDNRTPFDLAQATSGSQSAVAKLLQASLRTGKGKHQTLRTGEL